jgi:hypothetical protein
MTEQPPRRVRVVAPRRAATRASRRLARQEIDEQTSLGEIYMVSLLRTQLRLATGICLIFAVLLGGLPLLFLLEPGLSETSVLGIPVPWLLLGVFVHPVLIAGAWLYVRQAERNERDWVELVERS